jgi:hypothetical protein
VKLHCNRFDIPLDLPRNEAKDKTKVQINCLVDWVTTGIIFISISFSRPQVLFFTATSTDINFSVDPVNLAGQRHSKQRISWQSKSHARMPVKRFSPISSLLFLPLPTPSPLLPSFQSLFPPFTNPFSPSSLFPVSIFSLYQKGASPLHVQKGEGGMTNNLIFAVYRLWQRRRPRRLLHWRCVCTSVLRVCEC